MILVFFFFRIFFKLASWNFFNFRAIFLALSLTTPLSRVADEKLYFEGEQLLIISLLVMFCSFFVILWNLNLTKIIIFEQGMVLLTMAVSIKFLKPTCENGVCSKASTTQIAFFYTSLYIIGIGAGGTKPNISTFGADQFDDLNPHEKKLKASFFNWWMFSAFTGALFATLGLVYIQENLGWGLGYGIPTVGLILSLIIFYVGTPLYRHKVRRTRTPAGDLLRVVVAAIANARLERPTHPSELHELDQQYYITARKRRVHHTPVFRSVSR